MNVGHSTTSAPRPEHALLYVIFAWSQSIHRQSLVPKRSPMPPTPYDSLSFDEDERLVDHCGNQFTGTWQKVDARGKFLVEAEIVNGVTSGIERHAVHLSRPIRVFEICAVCLVVRNAC